MEVTELIANILTKLKVNQVLREDAISKLDAALVDNAISVEELKSSTDLKDLSLDTIITSRITLATVALREDTYRQDLEKLLELVTPVVEEPKE